MTDRPLTSLPETSSSPPRHEPELVIYYDGDCPFCQHYVSMLRIQSSVNGVSLHNLRTLSQTDKTLLETHGMRLGKGMIVQWQGSFYQRDQAVLILTTLSHSQSWFRALGKWFLTRPGVLKVLYPIAFQIRLLTLKCLGRSTSYTDGPT